MPLGYAIPVLVLALATLSVLVPPGRSRLHARASFRAGVVINEVPQLAFYLLTASTVLSIVSGDVHNAGGWIAVGIAVATVPGLAVLFLRGLRTHVVAEDFLRHSGITPAPRRRWPWARILVAPYYRRRHDVQRIANLSYGPGGRRQTLDVYRHRSHPTGAPVFIHFHGGGYSGGHKNSQSLPLIHHLSSRGWLCISANYRLQPTFGFRDHLADAKQVIAWAHEHAGEYGGDPATLIVAGSSAGAHLTALCALTQNDPQFQPASDNPDTSLTAAVCLNSWLGEYDPTLDVPTSPRGYLRADAPPFLFVHGDVDPLAPVADAREFVERLREVSVNPVHLFELPGGQHGFDLFHSPREEAVVDVVEAFAATARVPQQV